MTKPDRYLVRMVIFLVLVAGAALLLYRPLIQAFQANAVLNGLILGTLLFGIIYAFRQVLMLRPEVEWVETFRRSDPGLSVQREPTLLAPMATMLGERTGATAGGRMSLSALSMRSMLDSIHSRLDENRDMSRYLIGLLIFLGLLGTFWGLLETVGAVGKTIGSLSVAAGDFGTIFSDLKDGLQSPLNGMSIAFSSSLFGLAGSLVLGFLELQASQAQNRFYNDLEEWLSSYTRLSSGGGLGEGDQSVPAYVQALLEQTADSLENLQRTISRSEDGRGSAQNTMMALVDKLSILTDQMKAEQGLMVKLAENQMEIRPVLQSLSNHLDGQEFGLDEASRTHLRNLDVYVMRLLEEMSEGRNQTVAELRSEIKLLARTIAAMTDNR
ncbi:MAG: flagellar motor protein MotA [Alphaproteobacteria bacterium]|nr:flagellar motor protein MotA [Alphaproteobacteria bacterium]